MLAWTRAQVHLFRPWSASHFMAGLPKTANKIAVLDRTKEQGSLGEPLYLDVATTLAKDAVGE
jgi:pyruvate-ferredoxin/flavodoxin oxidoreductase